MMFINSNLPQDFRSKWRFLFSSQIHGESFSTLMGRIVDQGPSVIIIEDTNGAVFGGFASASWTYSPKFVGGLHFFFRISFLKLLFLFDFWMKICWRSGERSKIGLELVVFFSVESQFLAFLKFFPILLCISFLHFIYPR